MATSKSAWRGLAMQTVHQILLAGVIGAITLAANHLGDISADLSAIKTQLAIAVERVTEHEKRIENLEDRVFRHP